MDKDPTYIQSEIKTNPEWKLAYEMSEQDNDNAPIGWSRYRILARWVLENFVRKEESDEEK